MESLVGVVTAVTSVSVATVKSTMNEVIVRVLLALPAESVTVTVQSEYVPLLNETNVIVLFPEIAEVVLEEQEPPYVIVPTITDENV